MCRSDSVFAKCLVQDQSQSLHAKVTPLYLKITSWCFGLRGFLSLGWPHGKGLLNIVFTSNQPYFHTSVKETTTNLLHTKNHVCVINKPRGKTTTLRRVVCGAQPTTFYIFFSERSPLYSHDNTTRNCACACVAQAISFNSVYAQGKENLYTTTSTMVCMCVLIYKCNKNHVCIKQTEQVQQTQHQEYTLNRVPCGLLCV